MRVLSVGVCAEGRVFEFRVYGLVVRVEGVKRRESWSSGASQEFKGSRVQEGVFKV